jgi:superfamily II DNA helicase RecQ
MTNQSQAPKIREVDIHLDKFTRHEINKMANLEEAFKKVCGLFKLNDLNSYQKEALVEFVKNGRDLFINLPTGAGKSIIYLALPIIFNSISGRSDHIVVVVSPLVSLMRDQVNILQRLGVSSVNLSDVKEGDLKDVEEGKFSVVYGTPEAWLKHER